MSYDELEHEVNRTVIQLKLNCTENRLMNNRPSMNYYLYKIIHHKIKFGLIKLPEKLVAIRRDVDANLLTQRAKTDYNTMT